MTEAITKSEDRQQGDGSFQISGEYDRNHLFQRALNFEKNGDLTQAETYYLKSMEGLTNRSSFALLPHTLRSLADIYYQLGEYEKAVNFVKAEKFYYETALIASQGNVGEIDCNIDPDDLMTNDPDDANLQQAEQYENLAHLCLDKTQPSLALEYAAKAAKLRQSTLGDNHPVTKASLNFFATIYAEAGKQQYTESVKDLSVSTLQANTDMTADASPATLTECEPSTLHTTATTPSPPSILRHRHSPLQDEKKRNSHVHFDEAQLRQREKEKRLSLLMLWTTLVLCLLLLALSLMLLYCHSNTCPWLKSHILALHSHAHYYYSHYVTSALLPP